MEPVEPTVDTTSLSLPGQYTKVVLAALTAFTAGELTKKLFDKVVEIRRNKV